jgi:hypothetical protein
VACREGFEPPTARSVGECSASDWLAPVGSSLVTWDASSVPLGSGGTGWIVWMTIGMTTSPTAGAPDTESGARTCSLSNNEARAEIAAALLRGRPRAKRCSTHLIGDRFRNTTGPILTMDRSPAAPPETTGKNRSS